MEVPRQRRRNIALAGVVGASAGLLMLGFILFANTATRDAVGSTRRADAIVVLTGGAARIEAGAKLLTAARGRRLLISGVNTKIGRDEIQRLTRLGDSAFTCCVDLGYTAQDTAGNADETMAWARDNHFRSLIIVTASYHMPRSLAEIARKLPDVTLVPHPVLPKGWREGPWYLNARALRVLAGEYVKFLSAAARTAVARFVKPPSMMAAATPG